MVRSGTTLTAYQSADGNTFTLLGTAHTIAPGRARSTWAWRSPATPTAPTATALFDNVTITTPTPPTPPPAPTGLMATAGNAQVALSWNASTGATSYTVKRSTTMGTGYASVQTGITGTSYTNTMLTNGTTYYYVVRAVNAAGASGNCNEASATPQLASARLPDQPGRHRGQRPGGLTWTRPGATSYTVKRSQTTAGPTPTYVSGHHRHQLHRHRLINGTTYYYVVSASNATGESGNSNQASATPQPPPPPRPRPAWRRGWRRAGGADLERRQRRHGYTVKRGTASGGPYDDFINPDVTGTSYTDTTPAGQRHHLLLRGVRRQRERRERRQRPGVGHAAAAAAPPTDLVATPGNTQVGAVLDGVARGDQLQGQALDHGGHRLRQRAGEHHRHDVHRHRPHQRHDLLLRGHRQHRQRRERQLDRGFGHAAAARPWRPHRRHRHRRQRAGERNWSAVSGATSYTVKRATTSGGPYSFTQSGITGTSYTNTGLTNGTTYYYVVSASNGGGEGPNSTQVSATPSSGPTWITATSAAPRRTGRTR